MSIVLDIITSPVITIDVVAAEVVTVNVADVTAATQAEVDAGTVTNKYVSPKTLTDWSGGGGGSGDVVGPASATDSNFAAFDTTTGKLIKDSGSAAATFATAAQGTLAGTALQPGGALGTPSSGTLTNATGLPTAGLVDDAVTLAKMAAGTAGNLITYDASGDPVAVATGTAAQVLTSNGAGLAPTFQAAAGGGWALTGTSTLTGAVTIAQATNDISFLNGNVLFGGTVTIGASVSAFPSTTLSASSVVLRNSGSGVLTLTVGTANPNLIVDGSIYSSTIVFAYNTAGSNTTAPTIYADVTYPLIYACRPSVNKYMHTFTTQVQAINFTAATGAQSALGIMTLTGTFTDASGSGLTRSSLYIRPDINLSGGTGTFIGMNYDPDLAGGAPTTHYGLVIHPSGANNAFGLSAPTAVVHIAATSTARASLCLDHGTAPTSPVDGDIWTTTAGLFVRINGSTVGPLT